MAESKIINRPSSANTPPNCAICLGSCTNKCFSDSCMHEFCFQCLLEWSRVKAECPLCKQPFKSIIHNVKSNEEYDQHIVETPRTEEVRLIGNEDFLFLPLPLPPHRHEFHVRTTFTVDSRGEHAIQQMLLTHPLTSAGRLTVGTGYPSPRILHPSRQRRDYSATSFRRSIYDQNLWVNGLPDLSGRYRECSPAFYRNNPAARQRLVPWLNRELNALLYENTQLIMHVVDLILDHLLRHHICSRTFRNVLREYFNTKTDQFVHEFYNFMRSPFDMFGYDRSIIYTPSRPSSPTPFIEDDTVEVPDDNSDDSDVVLVSATNPSEPVTINLIDSDSDEPIMVSSCAEVPMPILPSSVRSVSPEPSQMISVPKIINLPPKLRYKHKAIQEKEKWRWIKKKHRRRSSSTDSSDSSSSSDEREEFYRKYKKRKLKKLKQKKRSSVIDSSNSNTDVNITCNESDTDDNKPLIDIIKKKWKIKNKKNKKERKRKRSRHDDSFRMREQPKTDIPVQLRPMDLSLESPSCSRFSTMSTNNISPEHPKPSNNLKSIYQPAILKSRSEPSTSRYHVELPKTTRSKVELTDNGQYTSVEIETSRDLADNENEPSRTKIKIVRNGRNSPELVREKFEEDDSNSTSSSDHYSIPAVKSEIREVKSDNPGPSTSKSLPLVFRREHNMWYVLGESDSSSD